MAGFGGLAMALAAPPYSLWPLAWVALVPLWDWGVLRGHWRIALIWGAVYHGWTLHWLWGLHPLTWMGIPGGASVGITLVCWLAVTAWGTLAVVLWTRILHCLGSNGSAAGRVIAGAALWVLLDTLWSWSPLFWNPLALTQSPGNLALLHLGRWGGPLLITAAIVAVNGYGAIALSSAHRAHRRAWGAIALCLWLTLQGLGSLWAMTSAQADSPGLNPARETLQIGIIQGNIPTRIKLTPQGIEQALVRYTESFEQLAALQADAVLMPEGAFPFVWDAQDNRTEPLNRAIAQNNTTAWVGAFGWADSSVERLGAGYTQSLFNLNPQTPQQPSSRYNKVRLVPLGEYIPLARSLGRWLEQLSPLPESMVPGFPQQSFRTPWGSVAVEICYEPAFAAIARRQVAQGARLILSSANLDPYSEVLMAQSEAHDVMRAIENDRWVIRAANTGYSGFITPHGQQKWRALPSTWVSHAERVELRRSQTPYSHWGDGLLWLSLGVVAGCQRLVDRLRKP